MTLESWSKSCWDWGSPLTAVGGLHLPTRSPDAGREPLSQHCSELLALKLRLPKQFVYPHNTLMFTLPRQRSTEGQVSQLEDSFQVVPTMSGLKYISF